MPADRPLRVLLVSPESTGGIGRHVGMLGTALSARGHAVTVVAPPATLDRIDRAGGVEAQVLSVRSLRRVAHDVDVVHAHGVRMGALCATLRAGPLVTTWHNAPIGGPTRHLVHAALERISARSSGVVLAASPDLVERAQVAGAPESRLCPVVAPVRAVVRRPPAPGEVPIVLAVARLHPQKRLDVLVDAVAGWQGRVRVLVAGDGPLRNELEQHARRRSAPVELLGARNDVAELLATATGVALPSAWEARPLVAQEALAAGVPLVATAVGGVAELVGDAALLVPPGDVGAFRQALQRLLDDPALRARLAEAGPRQAATWPDVAAMVEVVESAYQVVVSPSR